MQLPREPAKEVPIELLCQIISELDHNTRTSCRLVCRFWSAAASVVIFENIYCHQHPDIIESLQTNGLWAKAKGISACWSPAYSDVLVESLTSALSPMSTINIRCLGDWGCYCCPDPMISGPSQPEKTIFWALLTAVSRTNIQIKRLVLSNRRSTYFEPYMLPLIRNLISRNLVSLEELFCASPYRSFCLVAKDYVTAEEAEGGEDKREEGDDGLLLQTFLYACPGLKKLFLDIYSFAELPRVTMPNLTDLRVRIMKYDRHFPNFLKRHRNIKRLTVSIDYWSDEYRQNSEIDTSDYEQCEIFDGHVDPWKGRPRQDTEQS